MKLHLPKMLLTAVIAAAACFQQVQAAYDATTATYTGATGGIKMQNLEISAELTLTFAQEQNCGQSYFNGGQTYSGAIIIDNTAAEGSPATGLVINDGNGDNTITFAGAITGDGIMYKKGAGKNNVWKFTDDVTGFTGDIKLGHSDTDKSIFEIHFDGTVEAQAPRGSAQKGVAGTGAIIFDSAYNKVVFNYNAATDENSNVVPVYITNQISKTAAGNTSRVELSGTADVIFTQNVEIDELTTSANSLIFNSGVTLGTLTNTGVVNIAEDANLTVSGVITGDGGTLNFGNDATLTYDGTLTCDGTLEHGNYGYMVNKDVDLLDGNTTNGDVTVIYRGKTYTMNNEGEIANINCDYYINGDVSASDINNSGDDLASAPGFSLVAGKLTLDEDFTITGTSTITATVVENAENATTAKLIIGSGTTSVNSNNGQNLKSNIEIAAGATLEFLGTGADAIAYNQTNRTITVAGTMDVGTTRQTVGNWTFDMKGGTIQGAGQSSQTNIGLDFHAAGNINAKALEGATAAAPTVSTISTKVRMNGTLNVDVAENARLDVTGAIVGSNKLTKTGSGTLRLANNANTYNAVDVNGGILEIRESDAVSMGSAVTVASGAELRFQSAENSTIAMTDVTLNGGVMTNQAAKNIGSQTINLTSLTVGENGGTIGNAQDTTFSNVTRAASYNISTIKGSGDLVVYNMSTDGTSTAYINGGDSFTGDVYVQTRGGRMDLDIASETALESSVIYLGGGASNSNNATNIVVGHNATGFTRAIKGIQDAEGRVSGGNVICRSGSNVGTLIINTGDDNYYTNSGVEHAINLLKKGSGTQSFGGDTSKFSTNDATKDTNSGVDGTIEIQGGKLAFTKSGGRITVASLTLSGGTLDVAGSLTLNALTLDLSKYATTQLEYELVSFGTLTLGENVNLAALGGTVGEYTATVSQREGGLWLTYATTPEELGTLEVSSAVLTGKVLTLNIDANLTDVSSVDLMMSAQALADIKGLTGEVSLALSANDGLFTTVETDGATLISNVSFYNGAYAGEGAGMYKVEYIPEPTTATLSLLALAGLAARRRRK